MRKNKGFCSTGCINKNREYYPRVGERCVLHKICVRCGISYTPKVNHLYSWKQSQFCNKSCSAKRQKGKPQPWGRIEKVFNKCEVCGEDFWRRCNAHTIKQRFCSSECRGEAFTLRLIKINNLGGHLYCLISFKKCLICKTIFSVRPKNKKDGKVKKLCSSRCINTYCIRNGSNVGQTKCKLIYKKCNGCGKLFTGPAGYINTINHCNRTCFLLSEKHTNNNPSGFQKNVFQQIKEFESSARMEFGVGRKYVVDIYIPSKKLVIECDGDYWHKGREEEDRIRQLQIESWGFRVVRIPEKQWYKDPNIFRYI